MLRIMALAVLPLLAATAAAQAQTGEAIEAHLRNANPGCDIYRAEEAYRGALSGSGEPVVVMIYTVEGCGGGNNWGRTFGVFTAPNGRVAELRQSDPPDFAVDGARVANGAIEVNGLAYGPNDGRCCPSVRRSARYRVAEGSVLPAR